MTQRKFLQLAGIAVTTVWVFCITFAIAYSVRSKSFHSVQANQQAITTGFVTFPSTTKQTVNTTKSNIDRTTLRAQIFEAESVSSSTFTSTVTSSTSTTTAQNSQTDKSPLPKDKADIINTYVNGINALKNTQNFSMQKNDTLNVNITDVQMTGGSALKNTVMQFANNLIAPPAPESYTFIGGTDSATGATPNSTIAPLNIAAQVNPDAVTDATISETTDGGYIVNLTIQSENQTMHSPAPNLSTMVEVIDVGSLLPDGATLTDVNINYAPSTVKAVFDKDGRIVSIEHKLTSKGSGSGKMIVNVTLTMEGTYSSNYSISYN